MTDLVMQTTLRELQEHKVNMQRRMDTEGPVTIEDVEKLVAGFDILDEGLTNGGGLPSDWQGGDDSGYMGLGDCPRCGCSFDNLNATMAAMCDGGQTIFKNAKELVKLLQASSTELGDAIRAVTTFLMGSAVHATEEQRTKILALKDGLGKAYSRYDKNIEWFTTETPLDNLTPYFEELPQPEKKK